MKCGLYVSKTGNGWENLALDEYFLDHVAEDELILYFYVNHDSVIIGRGQNPWAECDLKAMARDNVRLVRRVTGGGAVFHDDGNLNFSFIAGEKLYDLERQLGMILQAVRALGIPCEFTGRNDLLSDGRKFSGNAFAVRGHARQHHGTLLIRSDLSRLQNYLTVDPRKLKAKGVKSVRSRVCNLSEFQPDLTCDKMLDALKAAFRAEYGDYETLTAPDEAALAPYRAKHSSDEWRLGNTPRFDAEIENRFPWGNVQLLITLQNGRAEHVDVFSDSMDASLPETVRARLTGLPFDMTVMADALEDGGEQMRDLAGFLREQ